ncbi:MAG: hypothetical protein LUC88_00980 [Prevotella sp.]|nr:hypothetical protein [Prevotella sp.]
MQQITFKIGLENKPQIEDIQQSDSSELIFKEQYKYCLDAIEKYLKTTAEQADAQNENQNIKDEETHQQESDNNIFAFIGDRGSGKTSCMLSIAKLLENKKDPVIFGKAKYPTISETGIYALDLIDPSFFDDKHNILAIFLATLFNVYDSKRNKDANKLEANERKLLELFHDSQRNIRYLIDGKLDDIYENDLQQLSIMAASIKLKKDISDLVDTWLKFIGKERHKLLITIDDIDLNSSQADEMAEQIRKYLIQDNIIVLMALKLDQFEMIKRNKFVQQYESLVEKNNADISEKKNIDIDAMVERYIAKMIPQSHRIYMPDGEFYMENELCIDGDDKIKGKPVKFAVLDMIFSKTRYLFYNTPVKVSYIIPRNLRDLCQLVSMLYNMKDYYDNQDVNLYNKTVFKNYLFGDWMKNNLDESGRSLIEELLTVEDYILFNKSVLDILKRRFNGIDSKGEYDEPDVETEITYIFRKSNRVYNISVGDVLSIIDMLEKTYTSDKDMCFLFMLRTIYSIRMYESYDIVTEELRTQEDKKGGNNAGKNDNEIGEDVIRQDVYSELNAFDKLVGGRFYNTRLKKLLPNEAKEDISRGDRKIDLSSLYVLIGYCVHRMTVNSSNLSEMGNLVKMAEFFMLCTARHFSTRHVPKNDKDYYDPSYRLRSDINYARQFNSVNINGYFDLNAFFFNITRIKKCYSRFPKGENFYNLVDLKDCSFLYKFKQYTLEHRAHNSNENAFRESDWLSLCSFRNAEVVQAFYDSIDSDNFKGAQINFLLADFFLKVSQFNIFTYDMDEDKYYNLDFSFVSEIKDWLRNLNKNEMNIFNGIYSYLKTKDTEELFRKMKEYE